MMREVYVCDGCSQRFTTALHLAHKSLPYQRPVDVLHLVDNASGGREDYCAACADGVRKDEVKS